MDHAPEELEVIAVEALQARYAPDASPILFQIILCEVLERIGDGALVVEDDPDGSSEIGWLSLSSEAEVMLLTALGGDSAARESDPPDPA